MPRGSGMGGSGRGMGGSGGGMGRMTGRGAGFCAGYDMPGFANRFSGRGFGMGSGRGAGLFGGGGGRGWWNCFYATGLPGWARFGGYGYGGFPAPGMRPDPAMEKQTLKAHADALETELEMIKQRLGALEENE